MKKRAAKIAALLLAGAMLCSCSDNAELEKLRAEVEELKKQVSMLSGDTAPQEAVEADSDETKTSSENETAKRQPAVGVNSNVSINETVILDKNDVKVTASDLEIGKLTADIKLTLENNSDRELIFNCFDCAVNGYTTSVYLYETIAAGKRSKKTVSFDIDDLLMLGITDINELVFLFDVRDGYDDHIKGEELLLTVNEGGYNYLNNSFVMSVNNGYFNEEYTTEYFSDEVRMDEDGLRILSQVIVSDDNNTYLLTEFENTTDKPINAGIGDISINGLIVQSGIWSSDTICSGARCVSEISLTDVVADHCDELFGLSGFSDIGFDVIAYDRENKEICRKEDIHIINGEGAFDDSGTELFSDGGIRIVYKGLADDTSSYSKSVHIWLLIENNSGIGITADIVYSSLSLNGFMTGFICYSREVPDGRSSALDIEVSDYRLEENDIKGIDEISEIEATVEITDINYTKVAEPTITVKI